MWKGPLQPASDFLWWNFIWISMWTSQRFNAQHCLVSMLEKWDNGGVSDAPTKDLSKSFECLLIAKL